MRHVKGLLSAALVVPFVGCTAMSVDGPASGGPENVESVSQGLITDCDYLDPARAAPLPVPVDIGKELIIRDLKVVEDPCRTRWVGGTSCPSQSVGAWTFGYLMSRMAGSTPPSQFVGEWLHTFEVPETVNPAFPPLAARPQIRSQLIDPWLVQSGCAAGAPLVGAGACALDLKKAPFRLLAIVNRVDLAGPGFGITAPGEARFVFGAFSPTTGAPQSATVILEYKLPSFRDALDWELSWHALSSLTLGSATYIKKLDTLTDEVTMRFAEAGAPNNGSSIGQVRVNEIQYGPDWRLREYTLQDTGLGNDRFQLLPDTTKQTPHDSLNNSAALDAWMVANEPAILTLSHELPASLMGGESTVNFTWANGGSAGPVNPDTRHLFALSTCNGCHSSETGTGFLHIAPRAAGQVASLSGFLGVSAAAGASPGLPATSHTVFDPVSGAARRYNEPWRRVCEATRILHGDPDPFTNGAGEH